MVRICGVQSEWPRTPKDETTHYSRGGILAMSTISGTTVRGSGLSLVGSMYMSAMIQIANLETRNST